MNVTIRKVAQECGVSSQTVSRIFNGKVNLHSPETVENVMRVATKLGYRPNNAAKQLRSGKIGHIAIIHDFIKNRTGLPTELLEGIQSALEERNLGLNLQRYSDERMSDESFVPRILREVMADGLLLNFHTNPPIKMGELIQRHRIPSIWLNIKRNYDCVYLEDYEAAQHVTEVLIRAGHKRIGYLCLGHSSIPSHYSKSDRLKGYQDAMKSAGLSISESLSPVGLPRKDEAARYIELMSSRNRPTALITYGICEMNILLQEVLPELGMRCPKDVQLCVFGQESELHCVDVTRIVLPAFQMGQTGVEQLLEKVRRPKRALPPRPVRFTFLAKLLTDSGTSTREEKNDASRT